MTFTCGNATGVMSFISGSLDSLLLSQEKSLQVKTDRPAVQCKAVESALDWCQVSW